MSSPAVAPRSAITESGVPTAGTNSAGPARYSPHHQRSRWKLLPACRPPLQSSRRHRPVARTVASAISSASKSSNPKGIAPHDPVFQIRQPPSSDAQPCRAPAPQSVSPTSHDDSLRGNLTRWLDWRDKSSLSLQPSDLKTPVPHSPTSPQNALKTQRPRRCRRRFRSTPDFAAARCRFPAFPAFASARGNNP